MNTTFLPSRARSHPAFTLIELLTVVAIVGLLAALLFPGIKSARIAANKARTRVQFNQWAGALENFRSEYGYYPVLSDSNLVNPPGQDSDPATLHLFHDVLAARRRDGSALPAYSSATDPQFPEIQNRRLISCLTFGDADFSDDNLVRDAFGNTAIAVLTDRNLDGIVKAGDDFVALPKVNGLAPGADDFPASGVRAGVVLYSIAPGATAANPGFVCSWK